MTPRIQKLDCIITGPTEHYVGEAMDGLVQQLAPLEAVETTREPPSAAKGILGSAVTGAVVVTVLGQLSIGLAANAIWAWVGKRRASGTKQDLRPGEAVTIDLEDGGKVTLIVRGASPAGPAAEEPDGSPTG